MEFITNSWNTVRNAASTSAEYISTKAIPAVAGAAEITLHHVDAGCMQVNKGFVEFLTKYPGIAMTLSPSSMVKMAVANHVDDLMGRGAARDTPRRPSQVINMTGTHTS